METLIFPSDYNMIFLNGTSDHHFKKNLKFHLDFQLGHPIFCML